MLSKKKIILQTNIRYSSKIIWHGENIAEIPIPTGSPFTHSYYYNFQNNTLSVAYNFPIYYDIENNHVLIWGNEDFELYSLETNELIHVYDYRRNVGLTAFWPYIRYYIKRDNEKTIQLHWEDLENNKRGIFLLH